jgi:hypothetical protein
MANAPLNPPLGTNNLLALALEQIPDTSYTDTGEPAVSTAANGANYIVATGNVTAVCTFPVNGVAVQPTVARGAYALQFTGLTGTSMALGPVVIQACDSTATNAGNVENVDSFPAFPAAQGATIVRRWASSLAAGSDIVTGTTATLKLANVVTLRAVCTIAGTINAVIKFVAVGTP